MPNRDRMVDAIRGIMSRRGLLPRPLSEAAGVSHSTLANFLNGETKVLSTSTLDKIARHLDLPIGALIGTEPDPLTIENSLAEDHPPGVPDPPINDAQGDNDVQAEQMILQRLAKLEAAQDRLAAAIEALTQALQEPPRKTGSR